MIFNLGRQNYTVPPARWLILRFSSAVMLKWHSVIYRCRRDEGGGARSWGNVSCGDRETRLALSASLHPAYGRGLLPTGVLVRHPAPALPHLLHRPRRATRGTCQSWEGHSDRPRIGRSQGAGGGGVYNWRRRGRAWWVQLLCHGAVNQCSGWALDHYISLIPYKYIFSWC